MKRILSYVPAAITVMAVIFVQPFSSLPASAQAGCMAYPETGKTTCGKFLQYWQSHGGLAQQGFPISGEMQEISDTNGKTYAVQYFERAVFEAHPEMAPPNDVLLSLLGVFLYQQKYLNGVPPAALVEGGGPSISFPETGHGLRGGFLKYWQSHGGLAQQGYPISDMFPEKSALNGQVYTVQYFQRAMFEYHPENAAPNDILLSQLGTLRYREKYGSGPGPSPVRNPTTPLAPTATGTPIPPTSTATYTPEPPTPTETNIPRPTRTAAPTACPGMDFSMGCRIDGSDTSIAAVWDTHGGGGQVHGTLTIRVEHGPTMTESVGGSGVRVYSLPCAFTGPQTQVDFSIELEDECGQSVSGSCGGSIIPEPCP
jgi:hypothetical protein